jgi:hypothetical protein
MHWLASYVSRLTSWWINFIIDPKDNTGWVGPQPVDLARMQLKRKLDSEFTWCHLRVKTPEEKWYYALDRLLYFTIHSQCSDPHDKIYAIIGMAQSILPTSMTLPITADYNRSVEETYTLMSSILITKLPTLDFLSRIQDHKRRKLTNLPS